ncbi:MFS domain-containing protein [Fusarium keratoplasticum]|uniref:MFS domain-containing protein n=1 Tax=Fusarium keratoplasticum TaxID=1328300 RepID=A0ACC0QIR8_9HYPO|nr:MFS domain-containing protein [Fusarium keratoplasticum]KAI8657187.1 MFS domain-containing protein [Fusarium keratoplasticum]KAI8658163.1 MFS domain-containing protein [Fusarium keratoplasticum]
MVADKDKIETAPRVSGDENTGDDLKKGQALLKSGLDELGYWDTVKLFWKAVLICNLISIAAAADGYQYTLNGNVIANKGFIKHVGFVNEEGKSVLNANYTALWGAMQSLGQLVAMVFMSPISDAIGRKMTLYTLWVILAGSIALETVVRDWKDWTAAKILAGIGVGALQSTLPVYIAEWSPSNIRGAMVLTYGVWNTLGKFLAPLVLLICEKQNPMNYKMSILTQWVFLGLMLPIFIWLPETPQYYAERGQDDNGKKTLARVNGKVAGYDVDTEYAIIKNSILEQRKRKNELEETGLGWKAVAKSYVDCFKGVNAKRTLGATAPACAQQLTGLSFLKTYSSLFFRQAGFDDPFLITTVITVIALVTSIVLMLWTDYLGRRIIVIVASVVCTLTMFIVGIVGQFSTTKPLQNFCIFVACVWSLFNAALGSLGWAFVGEIASQKLRARTAGLAAGISVIFGLTFNTSVPIMLDPEGVDWNYNTGWLFGALGVITTVIVWLYVPEPSKRNTAEMDEMYENGVPAWKMQKYVTNVQLAQQEALNRQPERQGSV